MNMIKRIVAMTFIAVLLSFSFAGTLGYEASASTGTGKSTLVDKQGEVDAGVDGTSVSVSLSTSDGTKYSKIVQDAAKTNRYDMVLAPDAPAGFNAKPLVDYTSTGTAVINIDSFKYSTDSSRRMALQNYVEDLQASGMSEQGQQAIINSMQDGNSQIKAQLIPILMSSTSADIYTAMKWAEPFMPIVRILLGFGAIIVTILLVLSTVFDLVFIGLPLARESVMNNDNGKGKPSFISADAYSVIKETESSTDSSGGYKNAYIVYFKRRAITYVILSVCLLYLVAGEMSVLISWLMGLAEGIVSTGSGS